MSICDIQCRERRSVAIQNLQSTEFRNGQFCQGCFITIQLLQSRIEVKCSQRIIAAIKGVQVVQMLDTECMELVRTAIDFFQLVSTFGIQFRNEIFTAVNCD